MSKSREPGKTALRIYMYLLESGEPRGVREIARALDIPVSTVHYHLRRLEELGLVKQREGGYVIDRVIEIEGFILIAGKLVPRLIIYSLFYLGALVGQIYLALTSGVSIPDGILSMLITVTAFSLFLFEGLTTRRRLKI